MTTESIENDRGLMPVELDLRDFFPPTPPERLADTLAGAVVLGRSLCASS